MILALDLFTGYGGITLALKDFVKPIAYVEIEEYAQKIIANRMADGSLPRAPIFGDVKNIEGSPGDCDIIYGGFPCQDISVAGNGKGLEGERSGLFYEVVRLTKEIRPTFVFLENVPAIRTRGLEQIIKEFTSLGYDCRWTMLSAESVGAPHKRERWFLLAHDNGIELRQQPERKQRGLGSPFAELVMEKRITTDSNGEPEKLRQTKEWGHHSFYKRIMETNSSNYIASFFCGVDDGCTFRLDRIKALGNGVVPLQVLKAFKILMGVKQND